MFIYGLGYILIYLIFFLMYAHALRKREALELILLESLIQKQDCFPMVFLL